ncbi:MAG: hypothetical protein PHR00_02880 [Patescibacteria group bacterium]|nr:hypothetical protein [Patescibacteria group bacterium]
MFDNYPPKTNSGSLGQAKPEDIFADLEQNANNRSDNFVKKSPISASQSSARPIATQIGQNQMGPAAQYGNVDNSQIPSYQSGGGNSLKYLIIGVVTFAVLLGGGFYIYQTVLVPKFSNTNNSQINENNQPLVEEKNNLNSDGGQEVDAGVLPPENMATSSELTTETPSSSITTVSSSLSYSDATSTGNLSGGEAVDQTVDSDNDGLTDVREIELGINPNKIDSDDDGLLDYEEVEVWKTNPLVRDTDGDGYSDGDEVKNKYNPNGPGKAIINK